MKRCPECAREIEDSATVCDTCAEWAASLLPGSAESAVQASAPEPPRAEAPASSSRSGNNRRQLLVASVVISGAALVTFGLLMMRSGPSSNVSAAAAVPAARQPAPLAASAPHPVQQWTTENRAHWTGNQRHAAAFELAADNVVHTWFGATRPSLIVRCMARTTQAFVYTGSPTKIEPHAEGKTVTVSVDNEPVKTERWADSDEHDALFAPDGATFAERLLHAQTLRFGYTPHNSSDVVAQFHVSGLAELIEPVAKECGQSK